MRARLRGLLAAALTLLLIAPLAFGRSEPSAEEEILLFALQLERVDLSDAIPVYQRGDRFLLPLGEVSRLLSIAIEVDATSGTATGFVIQPSRTFALDAKARTVRANGGAETLGDVPLEIRDDDIYVDSRALSSWIPVTFAIDPFAARITVTPREPLPIQLRRDREMRIRSALAGQDVADDDSPMVRAPYGPIDGPFIDQTLRFVSTRSRRNEIQFSTYATGDLLYSQADLYLAGTSSDPGSETRFTLSRKDPFANLLGPLNAREVAAGDVFLPGDDLLIAGASGNGLLISSYPLVRQTQFGRHTFRGNLPSGWDVELYQNDGLIRYQQSRADGLYEFRDVPLLFGSNRFRLRFYGPTGEIREEIYSFNIGETLAPAGKTYYRVAGNQDRMDSRRIYADLEHGLRKNMSISAAVASADVPGVEDEYARVGLSGFWTSLFAHGDVARSGSGGTAARAFVQTRFAGIDVFAQHAVFRDFQSEVFRYTFGEIASDSRLRFDGLIQPSRRFAFPLTTDLHHQRIAGGGDVFEVQQRVAAQVGRTFFSNQLTGSTVRNHPTLSTTMLQGSLIGSRMLRFFSMRGEANYSLSPRRRIDNFTVVGESFRIPGYVLQAGLKRGFDTDDTAILLGVNRNEGRFSGGISGSYSRQEGAALSMSLFAGFARDSRTGRWTADARPVAGAGAASTRVFIDQNGNGKWDKGEDPIPGAGFFIDRMSQRVVTGERGTALLTGIPPFEVHRVAISPATLEDPLLVPAEPSVRFVPRPGKPQVIDFPVLVTGEINGTTYFRESGSTRVAAGLQLEPVSRDDVIAETRSAYDGFYQFTTVRPGTYGLRVKRQQAERIGVDAGFVREVSIDATGTVLDGFDLVVDRRVGPPPAVTAPARDAFSVAGMLTACRAGEVRAVAGATLYLFGPAGSAEAQSAADGSFRFERVPPGSYLLVFGRETLGDLATAALPRLRVEILDDRSGLTVQIGNCYPD